MHGYGGWREKDTNAGAYSKNGSKKGTNEAEGKKGTWSGWDFNWNVEAFRKRDTADANDV